MPPSTGRSRSSDARRSFSSALSRAGRVALDRLWLSDRELPTPAEAEVARQYLRSRQLDLEVGTGIAVDVAIDDGLVAGGASEVVEAIDQFAGVMVVEIALA